MRNSRSKAITRCIGAADDEARTKAGRAFTNDVLKHVRDIADKYIVPDETADWALMFLPSEAVFAELHENFGQVVERAHALKVGIVSPTTLMAVLTSIRAVLKDVRMREQAGLIQKEVGALLRDVTLLRERAVKLQTHFNLASVDNQRDAYVERPNRDQGGAYRGRSGWRKRPRSRRWRTWAQRARQRGASLDRVQAGRKSAKTKPSRSTTSPGVTATGRRRQSAQPERHQDRLPALSRCTSQELARLRLRPTSM